MRELQDLKNKKVLVGLSGGIDSSIVANMLLQDGYEVIGVYMKLHLVSLEYHQQNIKNIDIIASYLKIPYHIIDLQDEFDDNVYKYFIDSYIDGITPNPCVVCNKTIKFGKLFEFAQKIGATYLATGHYAKTDGKYIYKAKDINKDQSYFLAQIDQNILPYILFPFGDKIKQNLIANIDKNSPLYQIAQNKQSSEICFVQDTYIQVLQKHTNTQQNGNVLDKNGNIIGKHKGYMHYTIGKRKGFDVPLAQVPQYVNKIDSKNNTITVGVKESLKINHIKGTKVVMYKDITDFKCQVKIRYRSKAIPATISIDNNQATIRFLENVYGVAIGQYAVFYDNDLLIGSCQITKSFLD